MGCDIHVLTETRARQGKTQTGQAPWVNVDDWRYEEYEQEEGEKKLDLNSVYTERDYGLFARLAGVRKYGDSIPTIADPRGIPWDVSKISKEYIDSWGSDGHSHSFLTFKELEEYQSQHAWDSKQFYVFMEGLKRHMKDVFWIRENNIPEEYKERFRIVFFFDN